jgi:DNA-binding transcriptional ArsR family regulator
MKMGGLALDELRREVFRQLASAPALRVVLALDAGPATIAETAARARMRWLAAYKVLRSLEKAGLVEHDGRQASSVGRDLAVGGRPVEPAGRRGGGRGPGARYRLDRPALGAAADLLADLADTRKTAREMGFMSQPAPKGPKPWEQRQRGWPRPEPHSGRGTRR